MAEQPSLLARLGALLPGRAWGKIPSPPPPAPPPAGALPRAAMLPGTAAGRDFTAAKSDRLVASWGGNEVALNWLLRAQLRTMRARSQQFCRDNPYGKRFLRMVRLNVVGHDGFSLAYHCRRDDGSIDETDSKAVLKAWLKWERRGQCDVTGRSSFNALCDKIVAAMARDGEAIVRKWTGSVRGVHRFQLQLLPAFVLNELHNEDLRNGNKIRLGVEVDPFGKAVAYHFRLNPGEQNNGLGSPTERVPASDIYHLFLEEEPGQFRGYPWTATVLRQGRHLETYDEAAIVAANVGAAKMGFYQTQDGDASQMADGQDAQTLDFLTDAEPGHFSALPPGWEFKEFNPDYPHQNYEAFVQAQLRRMAAGLDTSYAGLSSDRTSESFSSIRTGSLDEREFWKFVQGYVIENFLEPVSTDWLASAMFFDAELRLLPQRKFDKFNAPYWQGRRWDWVDPKADLDAAAVAVALRIKSRAEIIRERGGDPAAVWAELEIEDAKGFVAPHIGGGAAAPANDTTASGGNSNAA